MPVKISALPDPVEDLVGDELVAVVTDLDGTPTTSRVPALLVANTGTRISDTFDGTDMQARVSTTAYDAVVAAAVVRVTDGTYDADLSVSMNDGEATVALNTPISPVVEVYWDGADNLLGFFGEFPVSRPEIPASPTAQDIADVLVALGLATQAP